jgi:hypothetical protein
MSVKVGKMHEGRPMAAKYRWIITKDLITDPNDEGCRDDHGTEGPWDANDSVTANEAAFVMKDDDGEPYYHGKIYGDYEGFEPLDDFGTPNAGCTTIWYNGEML